MRPILQLTIKSANIFYHREAADCRRSDHYKKLLIDSVTTVRRFCCSQ